MKKLKRFTTAFILTFVLFTSVQVPLLAVQPRLGERLEYTFSYRGIFSGFMQMDIARGVFDLREEPDPIQGKEVYLASLNLTTEPFGKAEMLYPIRYRYRTWLEPGEQIPLLVSEYLETDEISEELLWFDRENLMGYRYVRQAEPEAEALLAPAPLLEKLDEDQSVGAVMVQENQQKISDGAAWDYLSLLYRLRYLDLAPGKVYHLPLYNGKRIKRYRVEVFRERLAKSGWYRPSFRLSLQEIRKGDPRSDSITQVWVSDDEERLPLRFYVKRSIGALEGVLETGRPAASREDGFSPETQRSLELIF